MYNITYEQPETEENKDDLLEQALVRLVIMVANEEDDSDIKYHFDYKNKHYDVSIKSRGIENDNR